MIASVELQVISKILTSESETLTDTLCEFDSSYYAVFKEQIDYILKHREKYGNVPDAFTFQAKFPDMNLVPVREPLTYLVREIKKNKQQILLLETFNKIKDLGSDDVTDAWSYLSMQCDRANELSDSRPTDIIHQAQERANKVQEYAKQTRIPTGFAEIDKLMYGGLSTVEELLIIIARTGNGKSWICTKMMESAQKNGFPVLYYSPEMQAAYLATRFDTWRGHFQNSQLFQGKYTDQYNEYIKKLSEEETSALILEDSNMSEGVVNVQGLTGLVKKHGIKLVIIDGLSYMSDGNKNEPDHIKYRNICADLFRMSKVYGCAVVVATQANRETRENKDDKGDNFPNLYNIESSDHPGRICTQAFAVRQIFDKHVLDIRLEKSRMANNQKPVLSYSWDINTGNMQYLPGGDDDPVNKVITPSVSVTPTVSAHTSASDAAITSEFDDDDDIEF
ncbi:MAG: AAA family ATPase [Bacteroidaceae bacterium]|nr:AAA family ATPase [Bacteroidaceae bacterium]